MSLSGLVSVLWVVVVLEGELPSQFQLSCRGQQVFISDFSIYCIHSFSLLSWQVPQSLLMRNIPITWCCHHHDSQLGWCSLGEVLCWICAKHNILHLGQKVPSWFHQTTKLFATWFQNLQSGFVHTSNGLEVGFLSNGFLLATWLYRHVLPPYYREMPHAKREY